MIERRLLLILVALVLGRLPIFAQASSAGSAQDSSASHGSTGSGTAKAESDGAQGDKPDGRSVVAPKLLSHVDPQYSEEASKAKKGGVVLVGLVIDEQGLPKQIHVIRGVGYGLDEKAVEAVSQYRFKPAMKNGTPFAVKMNIQVRFQIMTDPADLPLVTNKP